MKYINQLDYPDIPYETDTVGRDPKMLAGSVALAGCGICSLCMVVDHLTMKVLPLKRCLAMSIKCGANHEAGTDLKMLSPLVAEKYGLSYENTDDVKKAVECLQRGGRVIANVGGDRDDGKYIGVFSHGGHYITLISTDGREFCVLDPSLKEGKYDEPGRESVRLDAPFVYSSIEVLDRDASNRSPRYHLFERIR